MGGEVKKGNTMGEEYTIKKKEVGSLGKRKGNIKHDKLW